MSLYKYRVFVEVAQLGSLSKAAQKMNQTIPGVSYTISKLEQELGVALLVRNRSRIRITKDAERLLPHMIAVLNVDKRLCREVESIRTHNAGMVNLGSITGIARLWLPALIKDFNDEHPDIDVNLIIHGYSQLFDMLIHTTIDLALMVDPHNENISFVPFKRDKLYALFPDSEEYRFIMNQKQITIDELCRFPLIAPEWGNDEVAEFLKGKLSEHVRYSLNDAQTILAMVRKRLGVGIISELFLQEYPEDIITAPIEDSPNRIIGIASNSNLPLIAGAEQFKRFMLKWMAEHRVSDIKNM